MGMFPQSIQQSGIVGSLVNKLGGAIMPGANAAPARRQPMPAASAPASDSFSAADYDRAPTTSADWAGTRQDFLQDLRQDNPPSAGILSQLFRGGAVPA
jgi:hypothetical protein